MKAIEYVQKYREFLATMSTDDTHFELHKLLIDDFNFLKKQREVSTHAGLVAILREIEQRWQAAVRQEPKLPFYLFELSVKSGNSDMHALGFTSGLWHWKT